MLSGGTRGFEPAQQVGANLRRIKAEKGLSYTQIAERAELHRTHVGLIMKGKRALRIDSLVRLAGAIDVPVAALLEGILWEPDPKGGGRYRISTVRGSGSRAPGAKDAAEEDNPNG